MQVKDILSLLTNPDRIRIFKGGQLLYCGYLGIYRGEKTEVDETAEVIKLRATPDIKHKNWDKLSLLPPLQPEELPEYKFSDLQMSLYYDIYT